MNRVNDVTMYASLFKSSWRALHRTKSSVVKFDIEKSNLDTPLEISHVPTIKLYRGLEGKEKISSGIL